MMKKIRQMADFLFLFCAFGRRAFIFCMQRHNACVPNQRRKRGDNTTNQAVREHRKQYNCQNQYNRIAKILGQYR